MTGHGRLLLSAPLIRAAFCLPADVEIVAADMDAPDVVALTVRHQGLSPRGGPCEAVLDADGRFLGWRQDVFRLPGEE